MVEPCRHFLTPLRQLYSDKSEISIFEGAISDFDGRTSFYVYETGGDSQISTIDLKQKESIENSGWFKGKFSESYEVAVLTPTSLCEQAKVPQKIEFVDIDAEGSDMKILSAWPWAMHDVELFCIEHAMGKEVLINFMLTKGYRMSSSTAGNLFFVRS